jgi:ATP-dependent helicase/DNAse subunit B
MGLELIVGPPNSGRTGAILDRFTAVLGDAPLLVVPTADDVERFERELCERPGGGLGGSVTSMPGLFSEVARSCTGGKPSSGAQLTRVQRVWLCRAAARRLRRGDDGARLRLLYRSSGSPGFAAALESLLSELQAGNLTAADFAGLVEDAAGTPDGASIGPYERELAALFAAYEAERDELGASDQHSHAAAAIEALAATPASWRRPVFLYGFDDLSREQVELVAALAEACPVTVAVAWEPRSALAARSRLIGVLRDELGGEVVAELEPSSSHTGSKALFHLERSLFERAERTAADGSLELLAGAGERGEAELIGRRVAALIAAGVDPDEIAVAVRSPDRQAPLLARVLGGSFGIPVAAEASVPLTRTATGSTLLRLLTLASGEAEVGDLLAFLRGPARANPGDVDWLERDLTRNRVTDAAAALEAWKERSDREIWGLDQLTEGTGGSAALAGLVAELAADIAEYPHRRSGFVPSGEAALELRAAAEIRRAASEAAALGPLAPGGLGELAELLELVRVPLWRGPTEGRVRILSPYRLRASRVLHLFVAGLTDGGFPAPGGSDPMLSAERRRLLGAPVRSEPAAEERFLFYSCVSRPEQGLHLSWSASDESGAAVARSPFVDEIRALLDPPPAPDVADDELERELTVVGQPGQAAVAPEEAASPRDLRRSIARLADDGTTTERIERLRLPAGVAPAALADVAAARARAERSQRPGPLANPVVLSELRERNLFGASTLESYEQCSYVWFARNELRPQRIEPDPEPLETGGIVHKALEDLYRSPPAGARPVPETLDLWIGAGHRCLREAAAERDWDPNSGSARISLARLDAVLERFLRRDATTGGPLMPRPDLLEASFGPGEDDAFPAAQIGDFQLHGRIDRIDVSSDGKALVRDYKLSSTVTAGAKLIKDGKLQMPLYMEAVRGFGLDPIGGVYHPLNGTKEDRPRGLLDKGEKGALIPGETSAHVGTDFFEEERFAEVLADAATEAGRIVDGIRAGRIARNPREGKCPRWCTLASICRMERGMIEPDEEELEEGAA